MSKVDSLEAKNEIDYKIETEVAALNQFVLLTFIKDSMALERDETFLLRLKPRQTMIPSLSTFNVFFHDTVRLTIVDTDSMLSLNT